MVEITTFNPSGLGKPIGPYSLVNRVKTSELVFMAGQTAIGKDGAIVGIGDLAAQCRQIYENTELALRAVGAGWENVVHFTNYLVNRDDRAKFTEYRLSIFPAMFPNGAYPPNTLLFVDGLVHKEFLVEVQTIAAL